MLYNRMVGETEPYTKLNLQQAINLLDRYSLAEKVDEKVEDKLIEGATVHEMTQAVTWEEIIPEKQPNVLAITSSAMMDLYRPDHKHTPQMQYIWEHVVLHARNLVTQLEKAVTVSSSASDNNRLLKGIEELCAVVSKRARNIGKFREAIRFAEKSIEVTKTLYGEIHINVANSLNNRIHSVQFFPCKKSALCALFS